MYTLVLSRGFPTKKYSLNGIFEMDQAKALARNGCKVVFAAVDVRSIRRWRKWGIEKKELDGVHVFVINIPCGMLPNWLLYKIIQKGINALYKLIVKEFGKPDVLHAHFTGIGYAALNLKLRHDVPLVVTEHSSLILKVNQYKKLFEIASMVYKGADAIISVSPSLADVIEKHFDIKTIYIPNIVDTYIFDYVPRKVTKEFNFVSVGNLNYNKRMDLTVYAFYKAFKNEENVKLTIFGEGSERKKIEGLVKKYRLEQKVSLLGLCSREAIAIKLKESDCFVLASQFETFGVAYIEALSCGIPVIATKCGGPEKFVNKENGVIIPIDDVEALKEAMVYMYRNNNKYLNANISAEAKRMFSPDCIAENIVKVYEKVVK